MFILNLTNGHVEKRTREVENEYPDEVLDAEWIPELDNLRPMQTPGLKEVEEQPEPVRPEFIIGALARIAHGDDATSL